MASGEEDLAFLPAVELCARLRRGELDPVELTGVFLRRIEASDLNAFLTVDAEGALEQASRQRGTGVLCGLPVAFKDLTCTAGLRTTFGSKQHESYVPVEDSVVVSRVRAAGGVVLGKTNTPEYGYKGVTDNQLGLPCRNPHDLSRTPGGSSGGAAAAVAAGLVPLAEGTDGAGSIRIPASFCGVVGFKPSRGRVPRYPVPDAYYTLSHIGPIARTVADAALLLNVLAGPDSRDPLCRTDELRLRSGHSVPRNVAFSPDLGYARVDPAVAEVVERAARRFQATRVPDLFDDPEPLVLDLWALSYAGRLQPEGLCDELAAIVRRGREIPGWRAAEISVQRTRLYLEVERLFERHDLLLTPTMPCVAFPLEVQRPSQTLFGWTPFTYPFNLTGHPAISVPCGAVNGLPVGLQIVGPLGADATVLQAAVWFERNNLA